MGSGNQPVGNTVEGTVMAAGDLITLPYQLEYNGFLMGNDTIYDVTGIDGLDLIAVRQGEEKRPLDHGDLDLTPDLMPNRVLIIRGELISTDPDDFISLRTATSIREAGQEQLLPLVIQLHDGVKYQMECRCRRRAIPIDWEFSTGAASFTLMFWCPDPRIYSNSEYSASTSVGAPTGAGFAFDIAFDLSFGGGVGTSGQATAINEGDINTAPVVTLNGPLTAPSLINDTTGEVWTSSIILGTGDVLIVDFHERTVMLGGATRYSTVSPESVWWQLIPGPNVLRLAATTGTGTASFVWRSAWHALV
jgi:hypothetical protein